MNSVPQTILQPSPGNTRLDSQKSSGQEASCGLDWLDFRGLVAPDKITDFFDWVAEHCDDLIDWEVDRPMGRHQRFSHGFRSVRGGIYAYEPTEGAYHVWISLPGQALAGAGSTMAQMFIANQCHSIGLSCTRLDLYLDDATGELAKIRTKIRQAYSQNKQTGFQKMKRFLSWDGSEEQVEETLYLGSRQSASFVRIYDKEEVVRWERQTGRDIADTILADLLRVHEENRKKAPLLDYDRLVGEAIRSHLTNGISFVDKKDKNLSRGTVCSFWRKFLNWLNALQVRVVRADVPHMLEKTFRWVDRQVSKTLSTIHDILGFRYPQWIAGVLEAGKEKYRSIDIEKIKIHRALVIC